MLKFTIQQLPSFYLLLITSLMLSACNAQENRSLPIKKVRISQAIPQEAKLERQDQQDPRLDLHISKNVSDIYQAENGNIWLATYGDGVIRYDGESYEFISIREEYMEVRSIAEDEKGQLWFGTSEGLMKYVDGNFTNLTTADGLLDNNVWSLKKDSKGILWIATSQGLNRFDGMAFSTFKLPEVEPDESRQAYSSKMVHNIMEDSQGQMWFATDGGAFIYDGENLKRLSEEDGLCNNSVNDIMEDRDGNIWFATRHKGVCRWDGTSFTSIGIEDGVKGTNAMDLYQDQSGIIWFPVERECMYRYDGTSFTNFFEGQDCATHTIRKTLEDKDGQLWFGGWLGLHSYGNLNPN